MIYHLLYAELGNIKRVCVTEDSRGINELSRGLEERMIISVASGKGGTGKTLVATSLALSLKDVYNVQLLDCDVEEPNDHVFMNPDIKRRETVSIPVPEVDKRRCTYCGKCAQVCAFNAIAVVNEKILLFPELCHGCGSCSYLCPENAITEVPKPVGVIETGNANGVEFVQGMLDVGQAMAPPIIRKVKEYIDRNKVAIIDSSPGTSCPVVEAIEGSDFCILVTEPTPFGLNDLMLAVEVVRKLNIPFGIVLNRADVGDGKTETYCQREIFLCCLKFHWIPVLRTFIQKGSLWLQASRAIKVYLLNYTIRLEILYMKEVVILSGKGGTGKTSIVGSFAAIAERKVMADCDVDAADLHLLLSPVVQEEHEFRSGQVAVIDKSKCIECGLCQSVCRFDAIDEFEVNPISCEGCAFCSHVCSAESITMKECRAGDWFISTSKYGPLVHARLGIAQENSGKLVALVRQQAKELAQNEDMDYIISDGPPGIGCPVIASLSGAHLALLVTEPTLSGIHDLGRVLEVCSHFGVPALVCINKYDINEENTRQIELYCHDRGVEIGAKIPFDNIVTESLIRNLPVVEYSNGRVSNEIKKLWQKVVEKCGMEKVVK